MATENSHRLAYAGPRHPEHGFPMWFEDEVGTRLDLALGGDPLAPAGEQPPAPGAPVHFPDNFPEEAFYLFAEAELPVGGTGAVGRARLVLALEAAFGGTGEPREGARIVFARIRVRMDDVTPGATYVVTHPYGVTESLTADERGRVAFTDDRGVADERLDEVLHAGLVAPFLRWADAPPSGYLGDGVTARRITGSPFGTNVFRVDGPRVREAGGPPDPADPTNPDRVQTDLFTVQGRLAGRLGVEVTRATYARDAAGAVTLDVHARSAPGQRLELGAPRVAFAAGDRDYVARAAVDTVPTTVVVVNAGDTPATRAQATVTDLVTVERAEYSPGAGTLTVAARSSDAGPDGGPQLSVPGHGPLTGDPTVFDGVSAVPATLLVTSAAGGSGVAPVSLTGPPGPVLPLLADAGADLTTTPGRRVDLDGTSSRGDIAAWSWTKEPGAEPVHLNGATTPTPHLDAPAAGTLEFRLTLTGPGGESASDTVSVTVVPAPVPDELTVTRCEYRTSRRQWRIGGTLAGPLPARVVVTCAGAEIGSGPVDATGAWDVRRTLTAGDAALVPTVSSAVAATSANGGSASAPVNLRN